MRSRSAFVAAAIAVLCLTGCTGATSPQETTPVAPVPSVSPTETPAAQPEATWTAPDSCTSLDLTANAVLPGDALGLCVSEALSSYGSGTESILGDDLSGTIQFTYDPEFSFQGSLQTPSGPIDLTLIDGTMWIDSGAGPVRGDPDSANPEEVLVGVTGELYRIYADPRVAAEMIAAAPEWRVAPDRELRVLDNGDEIEAYRIVNVEPFVWHEIPADEYILWFAEDWTPVGAQGTMTLMGVTSTLSQQFYDLGEPVTIAPVE